MYTAVKVSPVSALLGEIRGMTSGWQKQLGASPYDQTGGIPEDELSRLIKQTYTSFINRWVARINKLAGLYNNADDPYLKGTGEYLDQAAFRLEKAKQDHRDVPHFLYGIELVCQSLEDAQDNILSYTKQTTHSKPKYKLHDLVIKKSKHPKISEVAAVQWSRPGNQWLYSLRTFGFGAITAAYEDQLDPAPAGATFHTILEEKSIRRVRSNRRGRIKTQAAKGAFTNEIKKYISRLNAGIQSVSYRHQLMNPNPQDASAHTREAYVEDLKSMLVMAQSLQTLLQRVSKWSAEDWENQFGYMFGIPKGVDAVQAIGENLIKVIRRALGLFVSDQPDWQEERKRLAGIEVDVKQLARVFGLVAKGE